LWLLKYDYRNIAPDYIQTGSVPRYEVHMKRVLAEVARMLKPGGLVVCVAGDVRLARRTGAGGKDQVLKTGRFLANLCAEDGVGLRVLHQRRRTVPSTRRYMHALSNSNGHAKRDLVERTFVAQK
jgi:ubiquinone/menaquinone biosynthesis C-methylase UbiE